MRVAIFISIALMAAFPRTSSAQISSSEYASTSSQSCGYKRWKEYQQRINVYRKRLNSTSNSAEQVRLLNEVSDYERQVAEKFRSQAYSFKILPENSACSE